MINTCGDQLYCKVVDIWFQLVLFVVIIANNRAAQQQILLVPKNKFTNRHKCAL